MAILLAALLASAQPLPAFVERPCADAQLAGKARCGTVEVPERRDDPAGRKIQLNIVILPATSARPDLPPLIDIDGGPGLASTKNAGFYLTDGAKYRARRDVVTFDQRGTGRSNGLMCPELSRPDDRYQPMFPVSAVESCRDRLLKTADLTAYGTDEAVADLDDVRIALGHSKIDIFALSYGTTVALRYLATFPDRVRAAVLMGVTPPKAMPPQHHAVAGQRAFDLLFADCASDDACKAAFPNSAADFDKALSRLAQGGAIKPEVFAEKLRSMAYSPAGARQIPWILQQAANGNMSPFLEATKGGSDLSYADGMFMSVICGEALALMNYDAAVRSARSTRFGDYRLVRQKEACTQWPIDQVADDHLGPISTQAAVLMISGRLDPVTPPDWADNAARQLPNARNVIARFGGHIFDGLSGFENCFDPMILRFYETGDAKSLNTSCLASMQPPPFKVGQATAEAED